MRRFSQTVPLGIIDWEKHTFFSHCDECTFQFTTYHRQSGAQGNRFRTMEHKVATGFELKTF